MRANPWKLRSSVQVLVSLCYRGAAAALIVLGTGNIAGSATSTGTLTVQATFTAGCSVGATTLDFGTNNGNTLPLSAILASATLAVTCTLGSPYSIGLDYGSNASGTQRRLQSGGNYINYNLFTDAAGLLPWLSGSTSTTCVSALACVLGTGTGLVQSIVVYGRIPVSSSSPTPGVYSDTVTITVTY